MGQKLNKLFESIENADGGFLSWFFALTAIITIRNFLEGILEVHKSIGFTYEPYSSILVFFDHFLLFYLAQFLIFTIIIHLLTGEKIEKISKVTIVFFVVIIFVPIIDYFFSSGKGYELSYFSSANEIIYSLKNAFNPLADFVKDLSSTHRKALILTPGVRIKVFVMCLLVMVYTLIKTRNFIRATGSYILSYLTLIFCSGALQVVFANLNVTLFSKYYLGTEDIPFVKTFNYPSLIETTSQKHALILIGVILISSLIWYWLYDRIRFKAVLKSIRPLRSFHYCFLTLTGVLLGYHITKERLPSAFNFLFDYLAGAGICLATFFAFQTISVVNDFFDQEGDKISNTDRPLICGSIPAYEYKILGLIYFLFTVYFAFNVSYQGFLVILMYIIFYLIYSLPPLRLKRFFPLNMFIIALNSLLAFICGFTLLAREKAFVQAPTEFMVFILISFLLGANIITIKDAESDKKTGVSTLPTILGEKQSKLMIAILVLTAYILAPFILKINGLLIILSVFFGGLSCFWILKKKWNETPFFITYLVYLIILVSFYLRQKMLYL